MMTARKLLLAGLWRTVRLGLAGVPRSYNSPTFELITFCKKRILIEIRKNKVSIILLTDYKDFLPAGNPPLSENGRRERTKHSFFGVVEKIPQGKMPVAHSPPRHIISPSP